METLEGLLTRFRYKPDWHFSVEHSGHIVLRISAVVTDADDHRRVTSIVVHHDLPRGVSRNFDWSRWLREKIIQVEIHECDEFFTVDGVKPYYPH
jgi:hypothetical protein